MSETLSLFKSKFDKLYNVFEQFYASFPELSDRRISELRDSWCCAKAQYVQLINAGESKSKIAAGLEQGLRELPLLLAGVEPQNRAKITDALNNAVRAAYPEFVAKEAKYLEQILINGRIRSENQFYLVHHRIDELEGTGATATQLDALYRLIDEFESRRRR
ncbi:hypothetical protein P9875_12225 [Janthinobacterium rivuli]|uniref:Uncharacterized protein n=1 Tax=Janthinobacterium rivuli TaxID=2751478 RepID=A0ABY8IAA3_9BURK|nr:hypothetical protein [Janthinobacterium rivuli]WFR81869.1 hypothetical protein P9875_12225 [Janthinobacterium rivuli]